MSKKVVVISVFEKFFQEKKEFQFTGNDGILKTVAGQPSRIANCALVEYVVEEEYPCRALIELPQFPKEIKAGDVLSVDCKNLELLENAWQVRNIGRYTPASQVHKK